MNYLLFASITAAIMCFVILCLVIFMAIVVDKMYKAEIKKANCKCVETVKVVEAAPVAPVAEVAKEESAAADDAAVSFSADKGLTLDDKYEALDKATKRRYDAIATYAAAVEGGKRFKNLRYEEYKVGSLRIVRMLIKRGVIVCEFMMQNQSFKSYVMENKISAKQSATVIKVNDDADVQVIKDTIDIVVKQIAEEKEIKKQIAREKRKAKRQA